MPGLAARSTIAYNHSLTLDSHENRFHPGVHAGMLAGNPVAEEMLEGARMRPPDFIVNTVLTPDDRLVLTMTHMDGQTLSDVADLMGWSLSKVKVRSHRARRKLRDVLGRMLD